ncbi:MAG: tetratricopeptide repeat protein [Bryobacteraceae bacterium]
MSDTVVELLRQALQARRDNRLDDAKRDLIEAVRLCREADARLELARAVTRLGAIERDLQHGDAALEHYEEAVGIYRAEGDALKLAHTVRHVGDIQREMGRADLAEPCYREALDIYRNHARTPPLDLANAIRGFALLNEQTGENDQARMLWEEARGLYSALDLPAGVAESSRRLALLDRGS